MFRLPPKLSIVREFLRAPVVPKIAFYLAAGFCLTPWATPFVALPLGAALSLTLCQPLRKTGQRRTELLLQLCVVLLGFEMTLPLLLHTAGRGAIFASITIVIALATGLGVGRILGLGLRESALISLGTAVCGGSAIKAVSSAMGADETDKTAALGTIFVLNTAALYLFPLLGRAMHMSESQFGTWAGIAVHDVTSVVGAAEGYGAEALQTATVVKLCRVLWIVPLVPAVGVLLRKQRKLAHQANRAHGKMEGATRWPWFIALFVLAAVAREHVPKIASVVPVLSRIVIAGLTLALFLIGATISRGALRALGWRSLVQGVVLWLFVSVVSLLVILRFGKGA